MKAKTHELKFHGGLMNRGFWLYVWEVSPARGRKLYYVGRTGDSSSVHAGSPYSRMVGHLGKKKNANMLLTHLGHERVDPKECGLRLIAHGPILAETQNKVHHLSRRDRVHGMEKALESLMKKAGYQVMNTVQRRGEVEPRVYEVVRRAFASRFPKLKPV